MTKWILDEICAGLALLMAAGLPGRPGQYARSKEEATAAVQAAAKVWALAVEKDLNMWRKVLVVEDEIARLRAGFQRLLARCHEWPAPASLLAEIQGPRRDLQRLPEPSPSHEQLVAGKAELAKIQNMLNGKLSI